MTAAVLTHAEQAEYNLLKEYLGGIWDDGKHPGLGDFVPRPDSPADFDQQTSFVNPEVDESTGWSRWSALTLTGAARSPAASWRTGQRTPPRPLRTVPKTPGRNSSGAAGNWH